MPAAPDLKRELPKLVGYREIEEKFGLTRRQLERMQRDGRFPLAIRLTGENGNRRAWPLDQVLAWLDEQRAGLVRSAVTNPSAVRDADVPGAIQTLSARLFALQGADIKPDDIDSITINKKLTDDEVARVRYAEWETFWRLAQARLEAAQLSHQDAVFLAYLLFPAIRAQTDLEIVASGREVKLPRGMSPLEAALVILATPPEERARIEEQRAKKRAQIAAE
jgi:predicted DNA-binding transcriptional regulator AlpA